MNQLQAPKGGKGEMGMPFQKAVKLLNRRSRNGQAIILLAFAFVTLLAFVGIAVDVALMFVRYSSLTRAVDAAAISAASQVREGVDYRSLQAAAQLYIKQQANIDVKTVRVETCETEIFDLVEEYRAKGLTPPVDPLGEILSWSVNPPPGRKPSELCKEDPQKLVRVSAQVDSPTTFLQLIGWGTVKLVASSLSQTAVLDVALVLDVSISQTFDTLYAQESYALGADGTNRESLRAFTQFMTPLGLAPYTGEAVENNGLNLAGQPAIRRECWYLDPVVTNSISSSRNKAANYAWGGCCSDPTTQSPPPSGSLEDLNWYIYDDPKDPTLTEAIIQKSGVNPKGQPSAQVISGARDGNYSDLICQPFKQVRDAARRFVKRLDFVRGDRLMLVTFNASVNPGFEGSPFNGNILPLKADGTNGNFPVITDKNDAVRTLDRRIYIPPQLNGRQEGCLSLNEPRDPGVGSMINWRRVNSYWTVSQCRDTNMGGGIFMARALLTDPRWIRREAVWVMVMLSDGYPNRTPSFQQLASQSTGGSTTPHNWLALPDSSTACGPGTVRPCPGDNIADWCEFRGFNHPSYITAANPTGDVWLDPKAGREPQFCVPANGWPPAGNSNPYIKPWGETNPDGTAKSSFGFCPWYTFCRSVPSADPSPRAQNENPVLPQCTSSDTQPPWWDSYWRDSATGLPIPYTGEPARPICIDWDPDSRHFCTDDTGRLILNSSSGCDPKYDPDDYARDQADFAGLIDYTKKTKGNFIAMFTIFFARQSPTGTIGEDVLGVKMLRYIADAGDNGQIDNRLQQWYRATRGTVPVSTVQSGGRYLPGNSPAYRYPATGNPEVDPTKPQDPCAAYDPNEKGYPPPGSAAYEALVTSSCGQFWYAKNIKAVNEAFTEIASRLFTRLSR